MQSIELLAPAKDAQTGILAIDHGADAVYIGASGYSARAAAGCAVDDIARLVLHAHRYDAKVYVALNTLLYDKEFEEVLAIIDAVYQAGADALIIQDMGLLECNLPPIALHASTQMHNHSPQKIAFLASVGFSRIILARELSLNEIKTIHTLYPSIELESFVHGSLCVSYSGQCYMSQAVAQRSANRGVCAQPCRSTYDLLDSRGKVLIRDKHLLSIKDLNRTAALSDMMDAGVCSFKIEGRLKDEGYVKNITAWYRQQLDTILEGRKGYKKSSAGSTTVSFTPDPERTFNRGYTDYFLNRRETIGTRSTQKSMGKPIGTVARKRGRELMIDTNDTLSNGDGLCYFDETGRLNGFLVNRTEGFWILPGKPTDIAIGTVLFRNHDHQFYRLLAGETSRRTMALRMRLYQFGEECMLEGTDETMRSATLASGIVSTPAKQPALASRQIEEQLAKLGDTIFRLSNLTIETETIPFLPISVQNRMRRELTEKLTLLHQIGQENGDKVPTSSLPTNSLPTPLPYPQNHLSFEGNVLNSKAAQFYRKHGVEAIEPAFEAMESYQGKKVMTTRYCLKYELGKCPHHPNPYQTTSQQANPHVANPYVANPHVANLSQSDLLNDWKEPLYLKNGTNTFRLQFHCKECFMEIYLDSTDTPLSPDLTSL